MQAGFVEEELKDDQQGGGRGEQDEQHRHKADGEPLADLGGVRERSSDKGKAKQDEDAGHDLREIARNFLSGSVEKGIVGVFYSAAENEDRTDAADVEQRRKGEQQCDEYAGGQAGEDRVRLHVELRRNVDEFGEEGGEGKLHTDSAGDPEQTAEQAEEERLQQVDFDDLRAARAERLHDGDGIQALLQVRAHGHGDADRAEHERDEAHQREQTGGAVQAVGDGG